MAYKLDASLGVLNSGQSTSQLVRTSTGNLYAVVVPANSTIRVYKSTNNGVTWARQDYLNAPRTSFTIVSAAIDGNDLIHLLYRTSATQSTYISYNTTTDTYGRPENAVAVSSALLSVAIAVDSNNIPHAAVTSTGTTTRYANRLGGAWSPFVSLVAAAGTNIDIQIDNHNVPLISYVNTTSSVITVAIGNKNNPSAFTTTNVVASGAFTAAGGTTLAIDASGNTWLAYEAGNNGPVQLTKHVSTDSWATWQPAVTNGYAGKTLSLASDLNDLYVFYERNLGGLAYDRYDTINGTWLGETIVQPQVISNNNRTPSFQPHNPFVKWSQYFNNGDTGANNSSQVTIEYLFDDNATIYYDKLVTAQLSEGFVQINFSSPTTTTSTSSTSTSTSTTNTTTSTSTSISTSSTSASTSTSQSTSTSSTSTSTSQSTSTSSTSSSISISTSSTSSSTSISTSSTSASTSLSTSTSFSISTSSTSSSTSVSTSSTSTSVSTSSTSTSRSTSTSSTSTSQSTSTTTSTTTVPTCVAKPPGTMADDSAVGSVAWTNPDNAKVSDNVYAVLGPFADQPSHYLKATNFGYAIPASSTITGITVVIERKGTTGGGTDVLDKSVRLVKGGVVSGDEKADVVTTWPAADTNKSYGGSTDLWGLTWTANDINASNFGVVLQTDMPFAGGTASVDYIEITVCYVDSGTTTSTSSSTSTSISTSSTSTSISTSSTSSSISTSSTSSSTSISSTSSSTSISTSSTSTSRSTSTSMSTSTSLSTSSTSTSVSTSTSSTSTSQSTSSTSSSISTSSTSQSTSTSSTSTSRSTSTSSTSSSISTSSTSSSISTSSTSSSISTSTSLSTSTTLSLTTSTSSTSSSTSISSTSSSTSISTSSTSQSTSTSSTSTSTSRSTSTSSTSQSTSTSQTTSTSTSSTSLSTSSSTSLSTSSTSTSTTQSLTTSTSSTSTSTSSTSISTSSTTTLALDIRTKPQVSIKIEVMRYKIRNWE